MISGAHQKLQQLREAGTDPAHGGNAAKKRGRANSQHQQAVHEWNTLNEDVPKTRFTEQILPLLQDVPLSEMVQATGLSKGYCSFIKRGLKTPHERHWSALEQLTGGR